MTGPQILFIVGTRPEAIKIWPVLLEAKSRNLRTFILSTGQQRHLLAETLSDLGVIPDAICDVPNDSGEISNFLSQAIVQITAVLQKLNPTVVLVQGDTGSALAGAIASHNLRIPVGHIEAGLRSGDLENPWPEEGNRRMIDSISTFLWPPTKDAQLNITKDQTQEVVGNTSVDALRVFLEKPRDHVKQSENYILVTLHRRESFGSRMVSALEEIKKLTLLSEIPIYFIEHPNPRVKDALSKIDFPKNLFKVIAPVPYSRFILLLANARLVVSDSGGIQEEATSLGVPLLVVRDKTERHGVVTLNSDVLVGSSGQNLVSSAKSLLEDRDFGSNTLAIKNDLFGDGYASERIISCLLESEIFGNAGDISE